MKQEPETRTFFTIVSPVTFEVVKDTLGRPIEYATREEATAEFNKLGGESAGLTVAENKVNI